MLATYIDQVVAEERAQEVKNAVRREDLVSDLERTGVDSNESPTAVRTPIETAGPVAKQVRRAAYEDGTR